MPPKNHIHGFNSIFFRKGFIGGNEFKILKTRFIVRSQDFTRALNGLMICWGRMEESELLLPRRKMQKLIISFSLNRDGQHPFGYFFPPEDKAFGRGLQELSRHPGEVQALQMMTGQFVKGGVFAWDQSQPHLLFSGRQAEQSTVVSDLSKTLLQFKQKISLGCPGLVVLSQFSLQVVQGKASVPFLQLLQPTRAAHHQNCITPPITGLYYQLLSHNPSFF